MGREAGSVEGGVEGGEGLKLSLSEIDSYAWWKIILRGGAIPGFIVAACGAIGLMVGLFSESSSTDAMNIGIGVGLFISLFGFVDIVASILFVTDYRVKTRLLLVLGFLVVWGVSLVVIMRGLS